MELIVLGAHGTWPTPGGATSGYLLRHDGFNLWLDMGSGTMANLQRYVDLLDVDAVVISHAHPDHIVDIYPFFYARYFHPERPLGLPLFAPPGAFERASALISESGMEHMSLAFDVREVEPGQSFEIGPFRVGTAPMRHPIPTMGMRFEAEDGTIFAYSADTGPSHELVRLARGADLLLSEATWPEALEELPPLHLSPAQAGEHGARAGVGRMILTHIWPTNPRDKAMERAGEAFGGPVAIAEEGMKEEV